MTCKKWEKKKIEAVQMDTVLMYTSLSAKQVPKRGWKI